MNLKEFFGETFEGSDFLFHYTSKDIGLTKILYDKKIKFNSFINSHDPKEYRNRIIASVDIMENPFFNVESVRKEINKTIQDSIYSFCLCQNNKNNYGWNKPRMWVQYAENHTGLCLVFSKSDLINEINDSFHKLKIRKTKISYSKKIPIGYYHALESIKDDNIEQIAKRYIKDNYNDLINTKHLDFKDENEFRLTIWDSEVKKGSILIPIRDSLKAVIFGIDTHDYYIESLKRYSPIENIPLYKMYYGAGSYSLNKIKIK